MRDEPIGAASRGLDGIHALIVEDINGSRAALRLALQYCGALVTSVTTAREAESILEELHPHVLVTDINALDDGVALVRAVAAMTAAQEVRVPTIAITAARGRREDLLAEGFVEVVEKPADAMDLCRTILEHLPTPPGVAADRD